MLDVFNYLLVPGELNARISRLENSARPYGVAIQCRWVERAQLGTSQIERLPEPPAMLICEDLDGLRLTLASPSVTGSYSVRISDFAYRVLAHARAKNQHFERVVGPFGRVHVAPAYYTTAVCGQRGVRGERTQGPVTCRACSAHASRV